VTTTPAGVPGVDYPAPPYPGITYVIPCGGGKLDHAAPAAELYIGSMFRHALVNVERLAAMDEDEGRGPARVLILSALHGLVELDTVLEPYDLRMGAPGSVTAETLTAQALALGIDWGSAVYAFLPRAYLARLDEALRTLDVYVQDVYEACGGNGDQRRVLSIVGTNDRGGVVELPDGPGTLVWIGADVNGFAWGVPMLVSYGRLRDAQTLPIARAPWVLDSRGFNEIREHGRWTIDPARYVADCRRYAAEIGHLRWVAPQDWPACAPMLERTGLTEDEHQERTVASVVQLRAMAPDLDVITVVTGKDAAGYLRMIAMYEAAGIDLRAERLPVGVGALVGRTPTEAADIVRVLHAAGLRNLHGFGVKGRVLDLVGELLASVDSAGWSSEARRRGGMCPHGLVAWERNCPQAAQDWGTAQRERAARAVVQEALPLFG
jgi:hypothetical protein